MAITAVRYIVTFYYSCLPACCCRSAFLLNLRRARNDDDDDDQHAIKIRYIGDDFMLALSSEHTKKLTFSMRDNGLSVGVRMKQKKILFKDLRCNIFVFNLANGIFG
jgi:hypothetical protein